MNVVFIGMMGTFKSTVAREVSKRLNLELKDTDAIFEHRFMPISRYFERYGEAEFRNRESGIVAECSKGDNAVISCGGGVVLNEDNMNALKSNGIVVLLTASPEVICERVGTGESRPLIKGDVRERIFSISAQREPLYKKYADITVDNTDLSSAQCVNVVLEKLALFNG